MTGGSQERKTRAQWESAEFKRVIIEIEGIAEGIVIYDHNLRYQAWNSVMEQLTGLTSDQVLGVHAPSLFPDILAAGRDEMINRALEGETIHSPDFLYSSPAKDKEIWLSSVYAPYRNSAGDIIGVIGLMRDVTERRQTEQALRESEERNRYLSDLAFEGIVIHQNFIVVEANATFVRLTGHESLESVIGLNVLSFVTPGFADRVRNSVSQEREESYAVDIQRKDGSIFSGELNIRKTFYKGEEARVVALRDITEQKKAEQALIREKERFRGLVEESPFGVSMIGSDGRYKYINPKFSELFGYTLEDIPSGREWFHQAFPDSGYRHKVIASWVRYLVQYRDRKLGALTYEVTCKDGTERSIHFRPVAMGTGDFLVIYEDLTEKRRLEAQLSQSEKLEAVGTLAGGIAHDFNNLLMGIQGYTSILQHHLGADARNQEILDQVQELVQSGADLTRQLLGFARSGEYEIKTTDLNEILIKSSNMFGRARKEITIVRNPQKPLWTADVDRSQIEQVLLNLYVNAGHAMPKGGQLYLATENVVISETAARMLPIQSGNYVCITVADNGVGMDEKTRQRIFEPFFTTREMGRGTGLGLASAYGIIQGHGGMIDVESEKGRGTTFRIYLRASKREISREERPAEEIAMGHETLLLVDDEEINVQVVREILEMFGYEVFVARNGQEAVDLFAEKKTVIDLVILDMIMPGMGGGDTFDALKKIAPDVKVILSSGYSLHGEASRIMGRGCSAFIQKPFQARDLSQKLREVLDKK